MATVARHVPKPLGVPRGVGLRPRATTPRMAPARRHALGVAAVIDPRLLPAWALQGMQHGLTAWRDAMRTPPVHARADGVVSFAARNALGGCAALQARERR
jgi:hypothetical protein